MKKQLVHSLIISLVLSAVLGCALYLISRFELFEAPIRIAAAVVILILLVCVWGMFLMDTHAFRKAQHDAALRGPVWARPDEPTDVAPILSATDEPAKPAEGVAADAPVAPAAGTVPAANPAPPVAEPIIKAADEEAVLPAVTAEPAAPDKALSAEASVPEAVLEPLSNPAQESLEDVMARIVPLPPEGDMFEPDESEILFVPSENMPENPPENLTGISAEKEPAASPLESTSSVPLAQTLSTPPATVDEPLTAEPDLAFFPAVKSDTASDAPSETDADGQPVIHATLPSANTTPRADVHQASVMQASHAAAAAELRLQNEAKRIAAERNLMDLMSQALTEDEDTEFARLEKDILPQEELPTPDAAVSPVGSDNGMARPVFTAEPAPNFPADSSAAPLPLASMPPRPESSIAWPTAPARNGDVRDANDVQPEVAAPEKPVEAAKPPKQEDDDDSPYVGSFVKVSRVDDSEEDPYVILHRVSVPAHGQEDKPAEVDSADDTAKPDESDAAQSKVESASPAPEATSAVSAEDALVQEVTPSAIASLLTPDASPAGHTAKAASFRPLTHESAAALRQALQGSAKENGAKDDAKDDTKKYITPASASDKVSSAKAPAPADPVRLAAMESAQRSAQELLRQFSTRHQDTDAQA